MDGIRMESPANVSISNGTAHAFDAYRPGVLRCEAGGVAFIERGSEQVEQLETQDIASVSISTHLIGADEVVIARKTGGAWWIRVGNGNAIVEFLRASGIEVKS
jgi:hypothetical protein